MAEDRAHRNARIHIMDNWQCGQWAPWTDEERTEFISTSVRGIARRFSDEHDDSCGACADIVAKLLALTEPCQGCGHGVCQHWAVESSHPCRDGPWVCACPRFEPRASDDPGV